MTPYAIVIGIDIHDADLELNDLMGAAADAADFAEWALDPEGGNVAHQRLFYWSYPAPQVAPGSRMQAWLQNPTPWPKPRTFNTRNPKHIAPDMGRAPKEGELKELVLMLQDETHSAYLSDQKTRCYVFLAGHGSEIDQKTCFLMGDYEWGRGIVSCDELAEALQYRHCTEVIMFLDCCRTTVDFDEALPTTFKLEKKPRTVAGIGRATTRGAPSWEFPIDNPTRGPFTHALTEGLRGIRTKDKLTFQELESYVQGRVPTLLKGLRDQVPDFILTYDTVKTPLIVAVGPGNPIERDIVFQFHDAPQGAVLQLHDDNGVPIGTPIMAGAHEVRVRAPIGRRYVIFNRVVDHFGPEETHVRL